MSLKAFSEGISCGNSYESYAGKVEKVIAPKIKRPAAVEEAIKKLRNVLKGKVGPENVSQMKQIVKAWHRTVWSKKFLERVKKTSIRDQEHKFINTVLRTKYPSSKLLTKVEKIAASGVAKEKAAVDILKVVKAENKSLMKSLTKAAAKNLLPKIVGLLGLSLVGVELYKRIQGLISKEAGEEFGEFYHKDVGWYS